MLLIACFKTNGAAGLLHFELNYNKHFNSVVWSVGRLDEYSNSKHLSFQQFIYSDVQFGFGFGTLSL